MREREKERERERARVRARASVCVWERGGSESARERGSEGARERRSEVAREWGSEGARERARERGREGETERARESEREREGERARERESERARERESKRARERETERKKNLRTQPVARQREETVPDEDVWRQKSLNRYTRLSFFFPVSSHHTLIYSNPRVVIQTHNWTTKILKNQFATGFTTWNDCRAGFWEIPYALQFNCQIGNNSQKSAGYWIHYAKSL